MKTHISILILSILLINTIQAQNQNKTEELSKFFNETDLSFSSDTYESTFVDEGDLFISEVMHLPQRAQNYSLNKVMIFADSALYSSCEHSIQRYAYDIYYVYGCEVKMIVIKGETCVDIKNLIINDSLNLDGVVFIGNIAPALYEANDAINHFNHTSWLCDMYYMDIDATWNDNDHDNIYDNYCDDFHPEIFVGRIRTNNVNNEVNELELFEKYMEKNHSYWLGNQRVKMKHAISYTDLSWKNSYDIVHGIKDLYGVTNYEHITASNAVFCTNDYLERLRNDRYEFVQLACHSYPYQHVFDSLIPKPNSYAYDTVHVYIPSSTIYDNTTKTLGMNLFCCSACKWTNSGYLGGSYVYSPNSSILSLVGSTKVGSMLSMSSFYTPLHSGKTIGQALVDWWNSDTYYQASMDTTLCWFFGLTIIGDPLVNFFHCTNSTCQDHLTLLSYNTSNSPLSYYLTSESINVSPLFGAFTIPTGDHCILNAPTVHINGQFECPLGSSLEILNEGCKQNCDE